MPWDQPLFAERFTYARQLRRLTQKEIGVKLKCHESTVSQWQTSDKNNPSLAIIEGLGEVLEVSPGWLAFGEADDPATEDEQRAVRALRKLNTTQRVKTIEMLEANTEGIAMEASNRPPRRRKPTEQPAEPHAFSPRKSGPLALEHRELEAFLQFAGTQMQTMPIERPLTIALRKIAMQLDRDSAPATSPPPQDKAGSSGETAAGNVPSATVPSPQSAHRKKDRPSS